MSKGACLDVAAPQPVGDLAGKEELYAKLLYLINAPAQRLVSVLSAPPGDLAVVINQGVEKEKFSA